MLSTFDSKKFVIAVLFIISMTLMMILGTIPPDEGLKFLGLIAGVYLIGQSAVDVTDKIKNGGVKPNASP